MILQATHDENAIHGLRNSTFTENSRSPLFFSQSPEHVQIFKVPTYTSSSSTSALNVTLLNIATPSNLGSKAAEVGRL